jgi:tetratricopeptide (TPR) repeat protein
MRTGVGPVLLVTVLAVASFRPANALAQDAGTGLDGGLVPSIYESASSTVLAPPSSGPSLRDWEWLYPQAGLLPRPKSMAQDPVRLAQLELLYLPPTDPRRSDLLLGLGDDYRWRAWHLTYSIAKVRPEANRPAVELLRTSQQQYKNRVQMFYVAAAKYLILASQDRSYARRDEVLFKLARVLELMGEIPRAESTLQQLVEEHPKSTYIPFALVRLGDLGTNSGKYDEARVQYSSVERYGDSFATALALYQRAWMEIGQGNRACAARLLRELDDLCRQGKIDNRQNSWLLEVVNRDLMSEALFDIFFALHWPPPR